MHHTLYVQLDHFYLNGEGNSVKTPIFLVRNKCVIGANMAAEKRGIKVGMDHEHARALAPDAEVSTWKAENFLRQQEDWLDVCTKYSGVIEPEDQHTAFVDLALHPAPVDVALALISELEQNYKVRAGIAPSKWVAKLVTAEARFEIVDPKEFLADLPIDHLAPVRPDQRQRLEFLGYRTIGDIAGIPLATLKRQFGDDALVIWLATRGKLQDRVQPVYPKKSIIDSLIFSSPVDSLETLDESLKLLAKRLGKRLREKDFCGANLQVSIDFEERTQNLRRRFAKPIKCPLSLLSALRLLLQDEPMEPIYAIRIILPKLERTRNVQADLLGKSEKDKSFDSALHNLRTAFGQQAVQSGREIQLPRRVRVLKEWKNALGWQ